MKIEEGRFLPSIAVLLIGCAGSGSSGPSAALSPYAQSVQNVSQLQLGLQLYASDWNTYLPGANWTETLMPYVRSAGAFHSPAATGPYGYALNSAIAGLPYSQIPRPDETLSIYDSTVLSRDAVAGTSTLPSPPRYTAGNTEGFADGLTKDLPSASTTAELYTLSQSRLKQDALGLEIYANDYDSTFPPSGQWMTGLGPYVRSAFAFHSPALESPDPTAYGYALNSVIAGQNLGNIAAPATTIAIFDSTDLALNATDPVTTLPNPPRYGDNNTIAYADGHVRGGKR